MKKKKTYKTNNPIIKEISIGDKFILNNGRIVTFVEYDENDNDYPFRTNLGWYDNGLMYDFKKDHDLSVKYKIPSLKDKIDLL